MSKLTSRAKAKDLAVHRTVRVIDLPKNERGRAKRVAEYYGENVFNYDVSKLVGKKSDLSDVHLSKEQAEVVAKAVTEWALEKGVTHFCHWFQPLTGVTAEKHDGLIHIDSNNHPIEKLSASMLMQGEPDASSFPHGGSRSTFEARGYTSWDITSPMFVTEGANGKTLCIPTAFVSYHGDALDIKTPLLRSVSRMNEVASKFLKLTGVNDIDAVHVTCGAEQEYFLVDKAFYYLRPDLVMTGKSLFGLLTSKNQQLEDQYFGTIPERVLAFMQEVEIELYKLGIPAKTRHNEVAPGQFELAQIFRDANVAADNNQMVMAVLQSVAKKHDFIALMHEKPFAGVNGSGKHLNWSLADSKGRNLLEPSSTPHQNYRFLALVAVIIEAVKRHSAVLRSTVSGHGNDHRLGANEAPPSIISVFLGETLERILEAIKDDKSVIPGPHSTQLDMGAHQLARLAKDNSDRNRTSPFAFTGNKFEFRAVGGSAAVGFPLTVLNAAVADVLDESNTFLDKEIKGGKSIDDALMALTKKWVKNSWAVVFNGDGYSEAWVKEAERRGLPNFRTTPDALPALNNEALTEFLVRGKVFSKDEIRTRFNVLLERYITHRKIEFETLKTLVNQYVLPASIEYKLQLAGAATALKGLGQDNSTEINIISKANALNVSLVSSLDKLNQAHQEAAKLHHDEYAQKIAHELMPIVGQIADTCNRLEEIMPDDLWSLPKYLDLLFLR